MDKSISYISKIKKIKALIIILVFVFFTFSTYRAVAYFFSEVDEPLENSFKTADKTEPSIIEDFTEGDIIKKNVKVKVNTTYASYVRVKVIVNWKDVNNNILAISPIQGEDYSISYTLGKWNKGDDGFYYYYEPLKEESDILIDECKILKNAPEEGYKLNVEVIVQAIQSAPTDAVKELWGVTVLEDGTITK